MRSMLRTECSGLTDVLQLDRFERLYAFADPRVFFGTGFKLAEVILVGVDHVRTPFLHLKTVIVHF